MLKRLKFSAKFNWKVFLSGTSTTLSFSNDYKSTEAVTAECHSLRVKFCFFSFDVVVDDDKTSRVERVDSSKIMTCDDCKQTCGWVERRLISTFRGRHLEERLDAISGNPVANAMDRRQLHESFNDLWVWLWNDKRDLDTDSQVELWILQNFSLLFSATETGSLSTEEESFSFERVSRGSDAMLFFSLTRGEPRSCYHAIMICFSLCFSRCFPSCSDCSRARRLALKR